MVGVARPRRLASLTRALRVAGVAALAVAGPLRAQSTAEPTIESLIEGRVRPRLAALVRDLARDGRALTIAGAPAFNGRDPFLPGKIAIGISHLIVDGAPSAAARADALTAFRETTALTLGDSVATWGIYYQLAALVRLERAGVLADAMPPATLAVLRERLDWRRFVRDDWSLRDLPSNYYGVAFSIARLRELLGWEDGRAARALLARTVAHYEAHSGRYGFSDETDGEGRFDRYSVLLIGELCQRFLETGLPVPPQLRGWLRRAVDVVLVRLTPDGRGFDFGRSIGAYGDTAFLELLAAAAVLGVLTPEERVMAHAFHVRAVERFTTFWYDSSMGSVNLWRGGRRTDGYRGIHRILGENLSLAHQVLYTSAQWTRLGWGRRPASPRYAGWLAARPRATLTWFARDSFDRALVTVRDGGRVFSLPIVNGGTGQHAHTPYFPIPFAAGLVAGVPEETFPQLVPALTVTSAAGGTRTVYPLAYHRAVRWRRAGDTTEVQWQQGAVDRVGGRSPQPDSAVAIWTRYRFTPGRVERRDSVAVAPGTTVTGVSLWYAAPVGGIGRYSATGAGGCTTGSPPAGWGTPEGGISSVTRCDASTLAADGVISWELTYSATTKP